MTACAAGDFDMGWEEGGYGGDEAPVCGEG